MLEKDAGTCAENGICEKSNIQISIKKCFWQLKSHIFCSGERYYTLHDDCTAGYSVDQPIPLFVPVHLVWFWTSPSFLHIYCNGLCGTISLNSGSWTVEHPQQSIWTARRSAARLWAVHKFSHAAVVRRTLKYERTPITSRCSACSHTNFVRDLIQ